jgi:hypothetical protein
MAASVPREIRNILPIPQTIRPSVTTWTTVMPKMPSISSQRSWLVLTYSKT